MIESLRAILKTIFAGLFGSEAGHFGYPIAQRPTVAMVVVGIAVLAVVVAAVRFSTPRVRTHEGPVIVLWLVIACAAHFAFAQLAYARLGVVVESDGANGFYAVAQKYSSGELLSRLDELRPTFSTHPRANLPGKILLYEALTLFTSSSQQIAYLIIVLSNLGGVLVYLLAKNWFQDSLTAFYALVLYLLLPARIYFFPLLNTLSPVFMLLVFWFVTRYLRSSRRSDLILTGVSLYVLVLFEPIPLAAMPVIAALVVKRIAEGSLNGAAVSSMVGWIAASFAAAYLFMRIIVGFDLVSALQFAWNDADHFNQSFARPYSVWIVHNLKDFFLNVGVAQTLVFAAFTVFVVRRLMASSGESVFETATLLTLTFLAVVLVIDLAGVNRGESVRLWIFLGVLMQILVARACAIWGQRRLFVSVLSVSIIQTAICVTIVAWIIP